MFAFKKIYLLSEIISCSRIINQKIDREPLPSKLQPIAAAMLGRGQTLGFHRVFYHLEFGQKMLKCPNGLSQSGARRDKNQVFIFM